MLPGIVPGDGSRLFAAQRLFLVDDDVELAAMVREYLEPEGFLVDVVHDGRVCLAPDFATPDLIILDVMLPGLSGFEVLKQLRRRSAVPVILLTARDSDTDRVVGLEIGADDYVPKPFSPRELVARIRAVLRRKLGDAEAGERIKTIRNAGYLFALTPGSTPVAAPGDPDAAHALR